MRSWHLEASLAMVLMRIMSSLTLKPSFSPGPLTFWKSILISYATDSKVYKKILNDFPPVDCRIIKAG